MADGGLKIELDEALADKVRALAEVAGASVESIVNGALADYVEDWSETLSRLAQYDRDGASVDAETAFAGFREAVAARFRHNG
jgi:hypothetical protein